MTSHTPPSRRRSTWAPHLHGFVPQSTGTSPNERSHVRSECPVQLPRGAPRAATSRRETCMWPLEFLLRRREETDGVMRPEGPGAGVQYALDLSETGYCGLHTTAHASADQPGLLARAAPGAGVAMWVTRDAANLAAPERVRQSACANEGADNLSIVPGDPQRRLCPCDTKPGTGL